MAKFVIVSEAPETLRDGEFVVEMPTFIPEIRQASARRIDKKNIVSASYVRSMAQMIAIKYDQEFDPTRHVKAHKYDGIEYSSEQDLSNLMLRVLEENYPVIFDKYIEHQLKNRPHGTKLVYFVGPHTKTSVFYHNGIDLIESKDVDTYLGLKPKKVVGKPAVTKEEADAAKSTGQTT
jgi:hypothetical protein